MGTGGTGTQQHRGRIRLAAGAVFAVSLIGVLIFANFRLGDLIGARGALPLKTVQIDGALTYLTRRHLADMVGAAAAGENLATLNVEELQRQLLAGEPWLAQVVLRKKMPDALIVSVVEHVPATVWNDRGYFDARTREVFYPEGPMVRTDLVRLFGVRDSQAPEVYDSAVKFIRMMTGSRLQMTELRIDAVHSYTMTLTSGAHLVLGRGDSLASERLMRFMRSYERAGLKLEEIDYIDLRYRDGYAVRRRAAEAGGQTGTER